MKTPLIVLFIIHNYIRHIYYSRTRYHVVFIIITIVKKYQNKIMITECVSGSRFRLAIISPRGLCFISEFYDTEFCDDIETRTSTAVAAIFRVCFVAASSETYVNQKKKNEKEKYDFPCSRFFFSIFYCETKSARKFNTGTGNLTAVSRIVNFNHRHNLIIFIILFLFNVPQINSNAGWRNVFVKFLRTFLFVNY